MPSRTESSVAVTSDTATFPEPLEVNALDTVRSYTIVVAAPEMHSCIKLACFASSADTVTEVPAKSVTV